MSVHSPGIKFNYHQKLFTGDVFYADAGMADDTGSGLLPETAKQTIQAAIDAGAAGDAVTIKAGTYDEAVDINKQLTIEFEPGVVLSDADGGTVLTVSASGCWLEGTARITSTAIGALISGTHNWFTNMSVSQSTTGWDINGAGNRFFNCRSGKASAVAFDIGAGSNKFYNCGTNGEDATIGYWIHDANNTRMWNCVSSGHGTAGFQIDSGTDHCLIKDCASGGGDGARIDNGTHNMWPNFSDTLRRENHVHIYPFPDGEGTAGNPITLVTDAQDETNGAASTADYWGEPKVLIAPAVVTARWDYIGNNIYATTTSKAFHGGVYRIVNLIRGARNAGNAWDEGATVLTFDDVVTGFESGDLIWITSSAYKSDGEIVRITDVTGAVVTIEREDSQFGAAETGLRWDHSTNIGAGTLYAYLCWRDEPQYHNSEFDYSAGSTKDFSTFNFPKARGMNANDGLIVRIQNGTDGTNGAGLDMTICYKG